MGHFVDELVIAWNIKGCMPSGCKDIRKNSNILRLNFFYRIDSRGWFHQHVYAQLFLAKDPKRVKIQSSRQYLFELLGSGQVKASGKMLMKSAPGTFTADWILVRSWVRNPWAFGCFFCSANTNLIRVMQFVSNVVWWLIVLMIVLSSRINWWIW